MIAFLFAIVLTVTNIDKKNLRKTFIKNGKKNMLKSGGKIQLTDQTGCYEAYVALAQALGTPPRVGGEKLLEHRFKVQNLKKKSEKVNFLAPTTQLLTDFKTKCDTTYAGACLAAVDEFDETSGSADDKAAFEAACAVENPNAGGGGNEGGGNEGGGEEGGGEEGGGEEGGGEKGNDGKLTFALNTLVLLFSVAMTNFYFIA
jgi:uncharacterized membrane protein YgcG